MCVCVCVCAYKSIISGPIDENRIFSNFIVNYICYFHYKVTKVESSRRFKKLYLMPPCLTLSTVRYRSRVSGAIQEKK